jgi:glycosyltransferase involved in cell wall biosynthesis
MALFAAQNHTEAAFSMTFSICIPNYNYAHYLGLTFDSIARLQYDDYEVVVSDNASTDGSLGVIQEQQKRFRGFRYQVNPVNLGFAPNLDRAASLATGDYVIMLSSDDLITPEALSTYQSILKQYPDSAICSAWDIIDSEGRKIGRTGPDTRLWTSSDLDAELSAQLGCNVYRVKGDVLLRRCLFSMATPFNFCTAAYPLNAYAVLGGYGGSRLINPDKWFHWRLLTKVPQAIYVDRALFNYRWHNQNQTAQQANTGALKYLIDEYRNTIEIGEDMLRFAGIGRKAFITAFVRNDIYRHGAGEFLRGRWLKAFRVFCFGLGVYPGSVVFNGYFIPFLLMLCTTPLGSYLVSKLVNRKNNPR